MMDFERRLRRRWRRSMSRPEWAVVGRVDDGGGGVAVGWGVWEVRGWRGGAGGLGSWAGCWGRTQRAKPGTSPSGCSLVYFSHWDNKGITEVASPLISTILL